MVKGVVKSFERTQPRLTNVGLLLLRVFFGGMLLIGHGWGKLKNFPGGAEQFLDPLGIGHTLSMGGAVLGEAIAPALVILGLLTRLAAIPTVFTMAVAAFVIHWSDPFFMSGGGAKEPALLYAAGFAVIMLLGPGRFSLDHLLFGRRKSDDA